MPSRQEQTQAGAMDFRVQLLLDSGIFNRYWYTAQTDKYFRSPLDAAVHFIEHGMADEHGPHPLMEPKSWPGHLREAWKQGKLEPVLRWFRKPLREQGPLSAILDPRLLNLPSDVAQHHLGGTLGWMLSEADPDMQVPYAHGSFRWGDAVANTNIAIDTVKEQRRLARRRFQKAWDRERESRWRSGISHIGLSDREGVRVSVIMPAWNREGLVHRAIQSVQAQTFTAWELIVVDDGSTDATAAIVDNMAAADARIRLIKSSHRGVSAARNQGLRDARGEWVGFLDTDNVWPPDYLELMLKGLADSKGLAGHSGIELDRNGEIHYRFYEGGYDALKVMNHIDLNVFMAARELVQKVGAFDEDMRRWVDHDLALRIARETKVEAFPFIGCLYDDTNDAANRITTSEVDSWQWVALGKSWVDWDLVQHAKRVAGRVTISMPVYQDWSMTARAVEAVLQHSGDVDVEVVVVDNGSAPHFSSALIHLFGNRDRVKYLRLPRNMNFAVGSNYGASIGSGEYLLFLNNDTEVREGWLAPLVAKMADASVIAAQPLLLYPDDSIQTAGTVYLSPRAMPCHYLANHPREDAIHAAGLQFSSITGACMLWRAEQFAALRGFDPIFVNGCEDIDLCLRALRGVSGHFAVVPESLVTHHESRTPGRGSAIPLNRKIFFERWAGSWPALDHAKYEEGGFRVVRLTADSQTVPAAQPVVERPKAAKRSVRWGLRYAAPGGSRGDRWGDRYFVDSLAASLRSCGVEAVSYRREHSNRREQVFDDVNLVIRGLDRVSPIPWAINILWIISHPDDVTVEEVQSYDLVFAASESWAVGMTERSGGLVEPLLQATDTSRFYPSDEETNRGETVFVGGNAYNHRRQVIDDAVATGVPVRLHGHGWKGVVPEHYLGHEHLDNVSVGAVYRGASRVLADHWPDMAAQGFIQNRIFDAVACGTPVITDDVHGLRRVFGSLVQTYESIAELSNLLSRNCEDRFGGLEERCKQAEAVQQDHSFDARADYLLRRVASYGADLMQGSATLQDLAPGASWRREAMPQRSEMRNDG